MKSEGLSERSALKGRSFYTETDRLPRLNSETAEESDVDEYYPFVIGHGRSFKVIDPKVYKQLRRHNIQPKYPVRIAECARKSTVTKSSRKQASTKVKSSDIAAKDEYCQLSPLAKGPVLKSPLFKPAVLSNANKMDLKKLPSFERRFFSDYDCYKAKLSTVESNPSSPSTRPTTKLVSPTNTNKSTVQSEWKSENKDKRTRYCGLEADEVVDCTTCMCCAKGFLYHCTKDTEDEGHLADDPCSCTGPLSRCAPRWACLTVLSIFLPCLWCYLPVAGCRKAASYRKSKKAEKLKAKPARRA